MFEESIRKHVENEDLVEIFTNPNEPLRFNVGRIIACDSAFFILEIISEQIDFDGFMLDRIDRVLKISSDTNLLKKRKELLLHYDVQIEKIDHISFDLVASLISYAKKKRFLVGIELAKSGLIDVQGFIRNVTQTMCELELVNDYGEYNGISDIALEDITDITCCSRRERAVEYLYQISH